LSLFNHVITLEKRVAVRRTGICLDPASALGQFNVPFLMFRLVRSLTQYPSKSIFVSSCSFLGETLQPANRVVD
jgi:hypothetical protein